MSMLATGFSNSDISNKERPKFFAMDCVQKTYTGGNLKKRFCLFHCRVCG